MPLWNRMFVFQPALWKTGIKSPAEHFSVGERHLQLQCCWTRACTSPSPPSLAKEDAKSQNSPPLPAQGKLFVPVKRLWRASSSTACSAEARANPVTPTFPAFPSLQTSTAAGTRTRPCPHCRYEPTPAAQGPGTADCVVPITGEWHQRKWSQLHNRAAESLPSLETWGSHYCNRGGRNVLFYCHCWQRGKPGQAAQHRKFCRQKDNLYWLIFFLYLF